MKSWILKNVTTFESDTQIFLKGLDMYNNKITRKLVLMRWTRTPPQSQDYYCSLNPICSGMGEVVPARTSPTLHPPSPPTVHQLS